MDPKKIYGKKSESTHRAKELSESVKKNRREKTHLNVHDPLIIIKLIYEKCNEVHVANYMNAYNSKNTIIGSDMHENVSGRIRVRRNTVGSRKE